MLIASDLRFYEFGGDVPMPALGPIGVFSVDWAGMLTALLDSSELKNEIAKRFGNSLSQLKVALASHK